VQGRGSGNAAGSEAHVYYEDKLKSLKCLFGDDNILLRPDSLVVGQERYPILHDVIILTDPLQYTAYVRSALEYPAETSRPQVQGFAEDIQYSFGEEWKGYGRILPEHECEFTQYFDLINLASLRQARVCDLGCGAGRWSYCLKDLCKEIVLVDFSDAIFVARKNLSASHNCLFFLGDIRRLPFRRDCCELVLCLGVLHHLPTPCLEEVRHLRRLAPRLLVFLYYALDNRPAYFRMLLAVVTFIRRYLHRARHPGFRKLVARTGALLLYQPLVQLGRALRPLGLSGYVPLYEYYHDKSLERIEQDVYDRFFTRIEQRVSREEILGLRDAFSEVTVSDRMPYWHFLCVR
jgi:SAM-dependent methyltransferase